MHWHYLYKQKSIRVGIHESYKPRVETRCRKESTSASLEEQDKSAAIEQCKHLRYR